MAEERKRKTFTFQLVYISAGRQQKKKKNIKYNTYLAGGFLWTVDPIDGKSNKAVFMECVSNNNCKNKQKTSNARYRQKLLFTP